MIGIRLFTGVTRILGIFFLIGALLTPFGVVLPSLASENKPSGNDLSCRLTEPAFCDTFDQAHPGGRGGDLDEARWSVARVGGGVNPSQGMVMQWAPAMVNLCMNMVQVQAPDDYGICNNHFMEGINDVGDYLYNSARPRQIFDFENRTGKIVFDVDAKAAGHGWWLEVWIADEPVPGPYEGAPSNSAVPRNGIGFVFGECHESNSGGLDKVFIVQDYQITNTIDWIQGDTPLHVEGCFQTADNQLNQFEIRIGTTRFEVWASDASEDVLKRVAWSDGKDDGWGLSFSRGYVSFLHVQYNAEKFGHIGNQTYHWDNIGFDGPVLPLARGYDIQNAGIDSKDPRFFPGILNLGYRIGRDGTITSCCQDGEWLSFSPFKFLGVDVAGVGEARLNLNLWYFQDGDRLEYRLNGKAWRSFIHPFPESNWGARGLSIAVPMTDLRQGTNTLELRASGDEDFVAANIELELTPSQTTQLSKNLFLPFLYLKR